MKTLLFILLAFQVSAQHIGIETDMLDIPDGYQLYKQDTLKAIMIISSDEWRDDEEYFGFPELMCGYVVNCYYRFRGGLFYTRRNRILLSAQKYLDYNKIELKNVIVWSTNVNVIHVKD